MYTTLISVANLRAELDAVIVVDCRFNLADPAAGERLYDAGHIPGALYAHLDRDLSGTRTSSTGRHPLPDPDLFARTLGSWGVSNTSQVIAYDADNGIYASRLWWLLRWLGHRAVAVLDGGFKAWQNAVLPITTEVPTPARAKFTGEPQNEMVSSAADVIERVQQDDWRVLDARAPERFRGDIEPIDAVAGHIPGAVNHPFALNIDSGGHFLSPSELKRKFSVSLDNVESDCSIAMCGSGVTACHNLLAMEIAGMSGAKLYAGSWSEWIRDPTRPIATGE